MRDRFSRVFPFTLLTLGVITEFCELLSGLVCGEELHRKSRAIAGAESQKDTDACSAAVGGGEKTLNL